MLCLVGLGLNDELDISLKGDRLIRDADFVYLETYTATLNVPISRLEEVYGRSIIEADRQLVESGCEEMLTRAETGTVVFLVVGDALCATTHADLYLRATKRKIKIKVVHNASVMNAIAVTGLQLYRFGQTISIPFFDSPGLPSSYYERILSNSDKGLHTLCLLDIRVKEQSIDNLMKGNDIFEPPRFMTVSVAAQQLLYIENIRGAKCCAANARAMGVARIGADTQQIFSGTLEELAKPDADEFLGAPLHSLVLCGEPLHEVEAEFFEMYTLSKLKQNA
eukprot:Lankesteria_metandrocarpae@DN2446_c0_g1_i1.p1